ncbi:CrcB family protein [Brachybacterium sp. Marseille-Q7125]|uniref:fluoride efflux transporter FluC n=1 Tax=Brachybacterium sp. Marseille-Q7125 TaxID=2932815 RepID=UPI001FF4262A|nr:CrcB family protein [Brachybacterium sp. Marseille-Q7125]
MSAGTYLLAALLVGVGGALGSAARWGLRAFGTHLAERRELHDPAALRPWLTLGANLAACFLLGMIVARLGSTTGGAALAYTMLSVGFCGGLSTLSTAAMDVVDLFRRGTYALAVAYVMLTAGTGMGALWLGLVIAA